VLGAAWIGASLAFGGCYAAPHPADNTRELKEDSRPGCHGKRASRLLRQGHAAAK